jgi:plasmid stabilization system protein ParE
MPAKSVNLHEEARREFLAAIEWYLERSEAAAAGLAWQVAHALQRIGEAPRRWPAYQQQTRKFTLSRFPFFVVYQERSTSIQILAIAHAHRRPGYWKARV